MSIKVYLVKIVQGATQMLAVCIHGRKISKDLIRRRAASMAYVVPLGRMLPDGVKNNSYNSVLHVQSYSTSLIEIR